MLAAAALAPLDAGWPGVASPAPLAGLAPVDPATRDVTPFDRAGIVRDFVDAAGGLETAGYCRTNHRWAAFANSAGQAVTAESADVGLAGIARRDGADGVARLASGRLADVDGSVLGRRAAAKANAAADPVEIPPDRYEVVLEPTAVADILEAFSMYAFNAKAVAERRSFVRVGEAQFDPSITLADDAPAAGVAFDADGTPTRRVAARRRRPDRRADPRPADRRGGRRRCGVHGQRRRLGVVRGRSPATWRSPGRRPATRSPRSTARSWTRRPPSWWRASSGASSSPTSGTPGCSTPGRSPSPASPATACG